MPTSNQDQTNPWHGQPQELSPNQEVLNAITQIGFYGPYAKDINVNRQEDMLQLGINAQLYNKLSEAAQRKNCLIFIRSTNPGVVSSFSDLKNSTGKTLVTKGKSSNFSPLQANLAFFSLLAKSNIEHYATNGSPSWQEVIKEQEALLGVLKEEQRDKLNVAGCLHSTFLYIPKMITFSELQKKFNLPSVKTSEEMSDHIDIEIEVDSTGYHVTHRVDNPFVSQQTKENQRAASTKTKPTWRFRWVKIGSFDVVNTNFCTNMKKKWEIITGDKNGEKFAGQLVPLASTDKNETYYCLYVHAEDVQYPNEDGRTENSYWSRAQGKQSPEQLLSAFSPFHDKYNSYRLLPVMAQAKKITENECVMIKYYEIMADYDVFCMCVSLKALQETVRQQGGAIQDVLAGYFPSFEGKREASSQMSLGPRIKSTRGMISVVEEDIRKEINGVFEDAQALETEQEVDSQNLPRRPKRESGPRFVLHGCEVNNYFYTERLSDLIMVLPDRTQAGTSRFRISSTTFIELATGHVNAPQPHDRTAPLKGVYAISLHYLFIFNMNWTLEISLPSKKNASVTDCLRVMLDYADKTLDKAREILEAKRLNKKATKDSENLFADLVHQHICRIAFYAGYYSNVFNTIASGSMHKETLTPKDRQITLNAERDVCQKIFNGFVEIYGHANLFYNKLQCFKSTEKNAPFPTGYTRSRIYNEAKEVFLQRGLTPLADYDNKSLTEAKPAKSSFTRPKQAWGDPIDSLGEDLSKTDSLKDAKKEYIQYILDHWFYHGPFDAFKDNLLLIAEVFEYIKSEHGKMETILARDAHWKASNRQV